MPAAGECLLLGPPWLIPVEYILKALGKIKFKEKKQQISELPFKNIQNKIETYIGGKEKETMYLYKIESKWLT
jgi:hypothetical protein